MMTIHRLRRLVPTLLFAALVWLAAPTPAAAQINPCFGEGCCCGAQEGGQWPTCADPDTECRAQPTAPYLQVCIRRDANPNVPLQLRSTEPPNCVQRQQPAPGAAAGNACSGAGCCCNVQIGGRWPDCGPGFECRQQRQPPYLNLCAPRGANPNAALELSAFEPPHCINLLGSWVIRPYPIVNNRECGQVMYHATLEVTRRTGPRRFSGTSNFRWDTAAKDPACRLRFATRGTVAAELFLDGFRVIIKYRNTGQNRYADDNLTLNGNVMQGQDAAGQAIVYTRR